MNYQESKEKMRQAIRDIADVWVETFEDFVEDSLRYGKNELTDKWIDALAKNSSSIGVDYTNALHDFIADAIDKKSVEYNTMREHFQRTAISDNSFELFAQAINNKEYGRFFSGEIDNAIDRCKNGLVETLETTCPFKSSQIYSKQAQIDTFFDICFRDTYNFMLTELNLPEKKFDTLFKLKDNVDKNDISEWLAFLDTIDEKNKYADEIQDLKNELKYAQYQSQWVDEHIDDITLSRTANQYLNYLEENRNNEFDFISTFKDFYEEYAFADNQLYASFDEFVDNELQEQEEELPPVTYDETKWKNHGDVNFEEYGGILLTPNGNGDFNFVKLDIRDDGAKILTVGMVYPDDIKDDESLREQYPAIKLRPDAEETREIIAYAALEYYGSYTLGGTSINLETPNEHYDNCVVSDKELREYLKDVGFAVEKKPNSDLEGADSARAGGMERERVVEDDKADSNEKKEAKHKSSYDMDR